MMKDLAVRPREAARSRRDRAARPTLEGLEDRMLLYSVTGDHFAYGSRITWSIMPDGTNLGGIPSNFVSTMNQKFGSGNWINAINDAFAQWENVANVNFAQVPDDGAAFGSGNYQQNSPEYGDIRIGGLALGSNTLAFTLLPPTANGGSDAGDMFFNTTQPWHLGSDYDLETVAIHEVGHALGMGHSTDINAAMYPYYGGVQQSPNTDDVNGIQSVWGPRQEDPFVQNTGNLTSAKAANVTSFMTPSNNQVYLPGLNVASSSETYWFKVTTPANASSVLTAQVQSSGLSELSPRVQIYNASLKGLAQFSAPANAYGTTATLSVGGVTPNTTYYIRVLGSNSGVTGTGAYAMTINMGTGSIAVAPPPNTTVFAQPDQGGGTETMMTGSLGGWLKQWVLSNESTDLSAMGLKSNVVLNALVNSVAAQLQNSDDVSNGVFDSALASVLQDMPTDFLDSTASDLTQPLGKSGKTTISTTLYKFFLELSVNLALDSLSDQGSNQGSN